MTVPIQAYFRTEDDAEAVKILLQTYDVHNLETGSAGTGEYDRRGAIVSPLAAGLGTSGTGYGTDTTDVPGQTRGLAPIAALDAMDNGEDDITDRKHVLSVQVHEKDYDEIAHVIRRNGGHIPEKTE
ncbi:hypothetical protein [Paenibacillus xerothermodurans]|nr:hypothetical protein [Paenibacillus xerothermodurans]